MWIDKKTEKKQDIGKRGLERQKTEQPITERPEWNANITCCMIHDNRRAASNAGTWEAHV